METSRCVEYALENAGECWNGVESLDALEGTG